jgi:heptosyltransferase-3
MNPRSINRILVIKLRHLGDVLLTSPVFRCLKQALPHASIDAYIYKESEPLLAGHPAINRFFLYDRSWSQRSLWHRLQQEKRLLQDIAQQKYDLVLHLTEGDRGALAALVSGASIRVGVDPGRSGFIGKRKIFTHLVKNCPGYRHAVERNLDALRVIGIFPEPEERILDFFIPEEARQKVESFTDFVAIHPVSRWRFKSLESRKMAAVVQALVDRGEKVILTSGSDLRELQMIDEIMKLVDKENVTSLAGTLTLKQLGALYLRARALITVDTVSLHIASALHVPVVALFGPTSEKNWGPWRHPRARVVAQALPCRPCHLDGCGGSKRSDCLDTLSVDAILEAYEAVRELVLV